MVTGSDRMGRSSWQLRITGIAIYLIFGWGVRLFPFGVAFLAGGSLGGSPFMNTTVWTFWHYSMVAFYGLFIALLAVALMGFIIGIHETLKKRLATIVYAFLVVATFAVGLYLTLHYPGLRQYLA